MNSSPKKHTETPNTEIRDVNSCELEFTLILPLRNIWKLKTEKG